MKGDIVGHLILHLTDDYNWSPMDRMFRDFFQHENGNRYFIDASPMKNGDLFVNIRRVPDDCKTWSKTRIGRLNWQPPSSVVAKCYIDLNQGELLIRSEIKSKAKNYKSEGKKDFTQWEPYLIQYHSKCMKKDMMDALMDIRKELNGEEE
jgi:hypothetical protein